MFVVSTNHTNDEIRIVGEILINSSHPTTQVPKVIPPWEKNMIWPKYLISDHWKHITELAPTPENVTHTKFGLNSYEMQFD